MPDLSQLNPIGSVSMGNVGTVLLVFFVAILILGGIGALIIMHFRKKQFKYKIPLTKKVGNKTIKVATYFAKDFPIGKAGDKLWFVKGVKKYISPATLQTAPNEYTHHEREDGEWVNVEYPDVDEQMKALKVKFLHQDMRANRLATDRLLEQRLMKKGFWEKWGVVIGYVIFFLVITVSMVIIFYQWSGVITQFSEIVSKMDAIIEKQNVNSGVSSIIPALSPLLFWREKKIDGSW